MLGRIQSFFRVHRYLKSLLPFFLADTMAGCREENFGFLKHQSSKNVSC